MMEIELIEYCSDVPNIGDYLTSIGCIKRQVVFPININLTPADICFVVDMKLTGIKDCDLTKMPNADNVVNAELTIDYTQYCRRKSELIREMWMSVAYLIYNKEGKENGNITA